MAIKIDHQWRFATREDDIEELKRLAGGGKIETTCPWEGVIVNALFETRAIFYRRQTGLNLDVLLSEMKAAKLKLEDDYTILRWLETHAPSEHKNIICPFPIPIFY